ncbi:hypothetical protein KIN20_026360 [Parelaphostrongylus tenuis]|uniref:Uncharacterized protein n=1 Tax=Parelaphostrongylus tenuis TaxID=148309 RepID=A0AAD5QXX9_PARTN|nr:hypothetical protein KIN20_026360 [Parelaphostrongylus tenuis]
MGLPHHDPPLPLPRIPEHDGVDAEERRPFRIYGNLINHVPPPLRDRRVKDGSSGCYDSEYKLFECNKDHVWPAIEKKEPNRFGITAEYRKNLAKVHRMLRSKARTVETVSGEQVEAESGDDKSVGDVFLEKEANGDSSNNDSLDSEDVKEVFCERQHLYLSRQSTQTVEVILRPNRNPKSSSRLISPRELLSFYLFVDEAATIAHLQQFVLMRTVLSCSRAKVSIIMSKIIWECKAGRMAMLQCIRESESSSSCTPSLKGFRRTANIRQVSVQQREMKDIGNNTAYTISTKDGDSTVYATVYPVQKLDENLRLTDLRETEKKSIITLLYTVAPSTALSSD